ncbi:hypothetical protein BIZ92_26730 [Achromobacter xylosoxidans]|uniref:Spore coat protein U/FanG domain-containing protein n=1 Tax=Alcaligenes xylosoxydans xylosoxydans TaxID=85698 RepID=A0A1R1JT12_ALCXX|nr:hypothetical protein BIZ92_26730 [Achromobacter xylosoxidans]
MTVAAAITPGCRLGRGQADVSTYGDIDLGSVANVDGGLLATSSVGAGTIVMTCTPGTDYRIAINGGLSPAGPAGHRRMKNITSNDNTFLTYILYQDASYGNIWADGAQAKSGLAKGGAEEFPIYVAVLPATGAKPGVYTDTVVVTVSY